MIDIGSLSWNLSPEEQQKNMNNTQITCNDDIKMLILPYRKQDCWKNCATLLSKLDDTVIINILPELFEWYKDLNWPGIEIIDARIRRLPQYSVKKALSTALVRAKNETDEIWMENLLEFIADYE